MSRRGIDPNRPSALDDFDPTKEKAKREADLMKRTGQSDEERLAELMVKIAKKEEKKKKKEG